MRIAWLPLLILLAANPAFATESPDGPEADAPPLEEPVVREPRDFKKKFTDEPAGVFRLIDTDIEPGTRRNLRWYSPQAPGGFSVTTPVTVVNGRRSGPVLGLTAAIHGDELNGIEIVRRVMQALDPEKLRGVVVGVPIVNLEGFWRRDRYIGDRRET